MLRSAPRLRRGALLIRGPWLHNEGVGPGSAEQRKKRCAESGTRDAYLSRNRPEAMRGKPATGQL